MAPNSLPTTFIILISCTLIPGITYSLPFVLFHGLGQECTSKDLAHYTESLTIWSGSQGYCIEIGNGIMDSLYMPMLNQTEIACKKVKNMSELREGYNIVGLSQGNMVSRGVIEFCDGGPLVKNYISVAGPHAGVAYPPHMCDGVGPNPMCAYFNQFKDAEYVYSDTAQENLAPASFYKIPEAIDLYKQFCKFLPRLSNEITQNSTYKERFSSLENLVLIKFDQEEYFVPKETAWFGYYPDGSSNIVLPAEETKLYTEDWIGLKTLDEAGKVRFINVTGKHLQMSDSVMKRYIVPYLEELPSEKPVILDSSHVQLPYLFSDL